MLHRLDNDFIASTQIWCGCFSEFEELSNQDLDNVLANSIIVTATAGRTLRGHVIVSALGSTKLLQSQNLFFCFSFLFVLKKGYKTNIYQAFTILVRTDIFGGTGNNYNFSLGLRPSEKYSNICQSYKFPLSFLMAWYICNCIFILSCKMFLYSFVLTLFCLFEFEFEFVWGK